MAGPVFGWEEWAALPALGVPRLKTKVDTGAWTSALHAVGIEVLPGDGPPQVRFTLHPDPKRPDQAVHCQAEVAARRAITSSNGRREVRPIILTRLAVGGLERVVEVSLTDRSAMTYRMLLGRRALAAFGALVDPSRPRLEPAPAFHPHAAFPPGKDWAS